MPPPSPPTNSAQNRPGFRRSSRWSSAPRVLYAFWAGLGVAVSFARGSRELVVLGDGLEVEQRLNTASSASVAVK